MSSIALALDLKYQTKWPRQDMVKVSRVVKLVSVFSFEDRNSETILTNS